MARIGNPCWVPPQLKSPYIWHVTTLMLVALGVRLWQLGRNSFWVDEVATAVFVSQPLSAMLADVINADAHPPLYYLFLWIWTRLTDVGVGAYTEGVEGVLRLPSVFIGVGTVYLTYYLGCKLLNHHVALFAAIFASVSPWWVIRDREARMYPLLTLLTLASFLLLMRAIERKRWPCWLAYGFLATALLYTHYLSFFILFGQAVYALGRWRELNRQVLFALPPMFPYLLWLPVFLASLGGGRANVGVRGTPLAELRAMLDVPIIPFRFQDFTDGFWYSALVLLLFWGAVAVGVWQLRLSRQHSWIFLTQLFLPLFVWTASSLGVVNTLNSRYVGFLLPYLYLLLALSLLTIYRFHKLLATVWALALLSCLLSVLVGVYPNEPGQQWREAASSIGFVSASDLFVADNGLALFSFLYYTRQPNLSFKNYAEHKEVISLLDFVANLPEPSSLVGRRIWLVLNLYLGTDGYLKEEEETRLWSWVENSMNVSSFFESLGFWIIGMTPKDDLSYTINPYAVGFYTAESYVVK